MSKCDWDELHWLYSIPTGEQTDDEFAREEHLLTVSDWGETNPRLLEDAYQSRIRRMNERFVESNL